MKFISPSLVGALFLTAAMTACNPAPLPDFSQTESISIHDDWNGLSPVAPIEAHYQLDRDGDQFVGTAAFSIGDKRPGWQAFAAVVIPGEVVRSFLAKLAESELDRGEYEPDITHTDDYPEVSITLAHGGRMIEFYSASQGEGFVPWKVTFEESSSIIHSSVPADALNILRPYLHQEILEDLLSRAER